jgi:protein-S-isoprenylcysteine O-methyltransferase Ste14
MSSIEQDSAGIVAPPPVLYLGALAGGFFLHAIVPEPILGSGLGLRVLGLIVLCASAALALWSFVTMRRIGTSADPRAASTTLATHGPFKHSRNPIYVAMTGLYVGLTCLGNSWWPVALLAPLLAVMHWGVVLREERYLEKRFGDTYLAYKAATRRWF